MKALWSLLDSICGVLKCSWGVLDGSSLRGLFRVALESNTWSMEILWGWSMAMLQLSDFAAFHSCEGYIGNGREVLILVYLKPLIVQKSPA